MKRGENLPHETAEIMEESGQEARRSGPNEKRSRPETGAAKRGGYEKVYVNPQS